MTNQKGTILLVFVGLVSLVLSSFVLALNVYTVVSAKQYLSQLTDQAALRGSLEIRDESYYSGNLLTALELDGAKAQKVIHEYLNNSNIKTEIKNISVSTNGNSIKVSIQRSVNLPFGLWANPITISASATAILQVEA